MPDFFITFSIAFSEISLLFNPSPLSFSIAASLSILGVPNKASNPFAAPQQASYLQQGGRVGRNMGGIIGFMDAPINIMYPGGQNNVLHGGISSILKKYKEIRSEL